MAMYLLMYIVVISLYFHRIQGALDTTSDQYIGCYKDSFDRDLPTFSSRSGTRTIENCISECKARSIKYAGLQFTNECFCGNIYGRYGNGTGCIMTCTGNSYQICGGRSHNSIYIEAPQSVRIGGIAGGAIAVVVVLNVIIVPMLLLVRRRRHVRGQDQTEDENVREGVQPPREGRDLDDELTYSIIPDSAISILNTTPPSKPSTSGSVVNQRPGHESSTHVRILGNQDNNGGDEETNGNNASVSSQAQRQNTHANVPTVQGNEEMGSQQLKTTKPFIRPKPHTQPQVPPQTLAPDVYAKAEYEALNLPEPPQTKLPIDKIKHHIMTADLGKEHKALSTGTRNQARSKPSHPTEHKIIDSSKVNPLLRKWVVECSTMPSAEDLAQFWSQINSGSAIVLLTDTKRTMDKTDLHWLPKADVPILLPTGLEVHEVGRQEVDGITSVTISIRAGSHEYANTAYDGNPDETSDYMDIVSKFGKKHDCQVLVVEPTSPPGVVAAWRILQHKLHFTACSFKRDQIDVFALCMFLLDQSHAFDAVDVPAAVKQLRKQHPMMISNVESYYFIYKVLEFFSEQ